MENVITIKERGTVVKVRRDALLGRINRRLSVNNHRLHASKSKDALSTLGLFYIVNGKGLISDTHVDPIAFGRSLGLLKPFEDAIGF